MDSKLASNPTAMPQVAAADSHSVAGSSTKAAAKEPESKVVAKQ
jgi:hypothetical protein